MRGVMSIPQELLFLPCYRWSVTHTHSSAALCTRSSRLAVLPIRICVQLVLDLCTLQNLVQHYQCIQLLSMRMFPPLLSLFALLGPACSWRVSLQHGESNPIVVRYLINLFLFGFVQFLPGVPIYLSVLLAFIIIVFYVLFQFSFSSLLTKCQDLHIAPQCSSFM